MNVVELKPSDVLFFRDGRPMSGSLSGHGSAWPMPNVINNAFHAALWRAGMDDVHVHRTGKSGQYEEGKSRSERFGSLRTAGPFPIVDENWLFPRPMDLVSDTLAPDLLPVMISNLSSLAGPLQYPVANRRAPSKESKAKAWMSQSAFQRYLDGSESGISESDTYDDGDLFDTESQIGIAIDPDSQTTGFGEKKGDIYSAQYLRIREINNKRQPIDVKIGTLADAWDKDQKCDLVDRLLSGSPTRILVGGQQRICNATRRSSVGSIPLPTGRIDRFNCVSRDGKPRHLVKWILLSPAVFPEVNVREGRSGQPQPGGWLPNWVCSNSGAVLLKNGDTERDPMEPRVEWRSRVQSLPRIGANLVAAVVPKPLVVTGWALANPDAGRQEGAKPAHLAVPAGAVYYFEADTPKDAVALAAALNWHGSDPNCNTIRNRRSTLLGEKGFGIGVCGTWEFYSGPK